ncbi:MAG: putative methyltransferase [Kiritimatiellia bacterium]|jgi:predicted methyltransferase
MSNLLNKTLSRAALFVATFIFAPMVLADGHTAIVKVLANEARPEADTQRDANRKPDQVLEFFGIEPDMKVIDIFAGGGYYAEILSYAVGINGEVTLYNNGGWDGFVGSGVEERLAGNRLPNVQSVVMEANELRLEENYYDAAVFVLGFHDLYYEETSWPAIDAADFVERLYRFLKPGGILGVVDHAAGSGVSVDVANILHRIDPGIIRSDLISAGFEFVAESDVLRNQGDDRNKPMSDPSVRGKTDRVVMKFIKPAS